MKGACLCLALVSAPGWFAQLFSLSHPLHSRRNLSLCRPCHNPFILGWAAAWLRASGPGCRGGDGWGDSPFQMFISYRAQHGEGVSQNTSDVWQFDRIYFGYGEHMHDKDYFTATLPSLWRCSSGWWQYCLDNIVFCHPILGRQFCPLKDATVMSKIDTAACTLAENGTAGLLHMKVFCLWSFAPLFHFHSTEHINSSCSWLLFSPISVFLNVLSITSWKCQGKSRP